MNSFEYIQPKDLKEASKVNYKNKYNSILFAGGTDVLGLIKNDIIEPEKVINLKSVDNLDYVKLENDGTLRIGALTKLSKIANHKIIKERFTALAQAAAEVATPQLRNVGTIAGNVCQRPRCFYFRGDFHCLRKGGDECFAVSGYDKYHCIIGGGPCYIVHASDTAVALKALNASVKIYDGSNYKTVSIHDFFILPEVNHTKENILEPGEIITEFSLPPGNFNFSKYIKVKERGAWDFALVSIAVAANVNSGKVKFANFAFGGVAPIPWTENKLNEAAKNFRTDEVSLKKLQKSAFVNPEPMDMNEYKIQLAKNLILKAFI